MSMRDRTKLMFVEELEAMLAEVPLSKVRVARLCARCGTTTPTFYYHFHDKYELVAWSFLHDYIAATSQGGYDPDVIEGINERFQSRKAFYQRCFEDRSQNSIGEYCVRFNLVMAAEAFAYANGGATMSAERERAVRYHTYGTMGLFYDWLFDRDGMTSEEMSAFLYERTPTFLKEAFAAYPYPADEILSKAGKKTRDIRKDG